MQVFTITKTGAAVDAGAARDLVAGHPTVTSGEARYDLVGHGQGERSVGVYAFIARVEDLFGAGAAPYGHARVDESTWTISYPDGQGDPFDGETDWVANAEWYDAEFPGFLAALGVRVQVGPGAYSQRTATLPNDR